MSAVVKRITRDVDTGLVIHTDEAQALKDGTPSWLERPLPHGAAKNTETEFWYVPSSGSVTSELRPLVPVIEVPAVFRQATRALSLSPAEQKKIQSELMSTKWNPQNSKESAVGQLGITTGYFPSLKECGPCVHPLTWSCSELLKCLNTCA